MEKVWFLNADSYLIKDEALSSPAEWGHLWGLQYLIEIRPFFKLF